MTFKNEVHGKKILIFGLGLQGGGLGDALWLIKQGALVRITDQKDASALSNSLKLLPAGVQFTLGSHTDQDILWADLLIKNPGVPDNQPQIMLARKLGKPVLTSIAVVVREGREKVIGITGTRGKSTTTEVIYQLLSSLYPGEVVKGGNIPATSGLPLLDQLDKLKYLVLELSSFQLHSFHDQHISPRYAVLTNMYPDHLNRYPDMASYFADKAALTSYQSPTDFAIFNSKNEYALRLALQSSGTKLDYSVSDVPPDWVINLPGTHNLENIAAVIKLASVMKINIEQVKNIIANFHGLPYRLESRRVLRGITYVNDTTSTTPTSTIKALGAIKTPTILIIGGDDKKLLYDELLSALSTSTQLKALVILGSSHLPDFVSRLKQALGSKILGEVFSMKEAVELSSSHAVSGDTVLLSPGFASFDLFTNEFDRGDQFNAVVAGLS